MSFAELACAPQTDPRRAALLLHAMAPADRDWLLERMPAPAGQALRGLLIELAELGIPPDTELLGSVLQVPRSHEALAAPAVHAEVSEDAPFLMALDAGGIDALVRAWQGQPSRLVARALCLRPWPWRPLALEKLPLPQRRRVMDLMESMSLDAPGDNAMAVALMAAMRRCCEHAGDAVGAVPTVRPAGRGNERGHGLLRWLKRGL